MPLRNSRVLHPRFHDEVRRSSVGTAGMPDECTIVHPTAGQGTVDPTSGLWFPPPGVTVYTGICRVQAEVRSIRAHLVDTADIATSLHRYRASIPWDAGQVLVDDILTVTRTHDPQLAGRPLVIRDVRYDTFQTRRFLDLEDHSDLATP